MKTSGSSVGAIVGVHVGSVGSRNVSFPSRHSRLTTRPEVLHDVEADEVAPLLGQRRGRLDLRRGRLDGLAGDRAELHRQQRRGAEAVEQRDRADLLLGVEARVRDEPVVAARVHDPDDVVAAERVPADRPRARPLRVDEIARLVHLGGRLLRQHRLGVELAREPAREILDARPQAALGLEDAGLGRRRLELVGEEARLVADRLPRAQPLQERVERGRGHLQRRQDPRADVPRVRHAATRARRARRAAGSRGSSTSTACSAARSARCRRRGRGSRGLALVEDQREVGVRRLALQARLVREQPPDREPLDRPERAPRARELGDVRRRGDRRGRACPRRGAA